MDAVYHAYVYMTSVSYTKLMYLCVISKALDTSFNAEQLFHLRKWFLMCRVF